MLIHKVLAFFKHVMLTSSLLFYHVVRLDEVAGKDKKVSVVKKFLALLVV